MSFQKENNQMDDNSLSAGICVQAQHTLWCICKQIVAIYQTTMTVYGTGRWAHINVKLLHFKLQWCILIRLQFDRDPTFLQIFVIQTHTIYHFFTLASNLQSFALGSMGVNIDKQTDDKQMPPNIIFLQHVR